MELPGWDRPRSLQLQVSRFVCSNHRSTDGGTRADLATCLERIQSNTGGLCFTSAFPVREDDLSPISEGLISHTAAPVIPPSSTSEWKRDLLWSKEDTQVWFLHLDPFWADFYAVNSPTSKPKALPFIGTVPISAWIHPDTGRFIFRLRVALVLTAFCSQNECAESSRSAV